MRQKGGVPRRGVTRKTAILVVGELGWPLLADGRPSKSLSLAQSHHITISSERHFLEWGGRSVPDTQAKTYSTSQISSLSGLPLEVIEQLTATYHHIIEAALSAQPPPPPRPPGHRGRVKRAVSQELSGSPSTRCAIHSVIHE